NADAQRAQPEAATGEKTHKLVRAQSYMIAAANPLASEAGNGILAKGGSAIDATIAAQMVLNLVEPQSSGIGGGAFILHWNEKNKKLRTYDAREAAPMMARPDRFYGPDGKRLKFQQAVFSGLSIGVPGLLKGLELAHRKHGKLPWKDLFVPAIQLAQEGFAVSPRLHQLLQKRGAEQFGPQARAYFFDSSDSPRPVGHQLKNPAFAEVLKQIAEKGADEFYVGKLASDIVNRVKSIKTIPGDLSLTDMTIYRAKEREPVCTDYRGSKVCGMGPPSSGALTINYVLKLVEPFDLGSKPLNAEALHVLAEAQKLAYADRGRYMADSDFVNVPTGLMDQNYLDSRRQLIDPKNAMAKASPGEPHGVKKTEFGRDATIESSGTSHISVVDADGNAVSMTTTIESAFGSRHMVRGFLLNNELTDFSFRYMDDQGRIIANGVQPGKRPRSSMAPTIVFDENDNVQMVLGSPGGSRIINYVTKVIIAHFNWKMDIQSAVNLANFGSRNGPFEIENNGDHAGLTGALETLGQKVSKKPMTSGLHVISRKDSGWLGAADPRREGVALGK
ncbi:MAG: gamma-glutamyltransferase, partial [Methyloligellaceae bacterium]